MRMNAVKISVLLIVFCSSFIAMPCYAAGMVPYGETRALSLGTVREDSVNNVLGNLEGVGNGTELGNASEAATAIYSIGAAVTNPTVNPGEILKIAVYLSGSGMPEKYKLTVIWSYPKVIDEEEGNITFLNYDSSGNGTVGFKTVPLAAGNLNAAYSGWVVPSNVIFATVPQSMQPDFPDKIGIRLVMGEFTWDGNPPILIELETRNNAPAGDYQVGLILTYGNETNLKQDSKFVEFHIRSMWWWWPRENWLFVASVFGGVTAWLALMVQARGTICRRSRPGSEEGKPKGRQKDRR